MTTKLPDAGRTTRLSPFGFLAGVVLSFAACCLAGYQSSRQNLYQDFERFHVFISPETYHYPTASHVLEVGRHELDRDKIAVVVGGNSILNGVGQGAGHIWSNHLREELGDDYRVVNLSMRGAYSFEFAGEAFAALSQEYPRILYVTMVPLNAGAIDGGTYRYLLWDSYHHGLTSPGREELVHKLRDYYKGREEHAELERQMWLDQWFHSRALWNTISYHWFSSVYHPILASKSTLPRQSWKDPEAFFESRPFEQRFRPDTLEAEMRIVKGVASLGPLWSGDSPQPVQTLKAALPEHLHSSVLFLGVPDCRYYTDQLEPHDREAYAKTLKLRVEQLDRAGFASMQVGGTWNTDEYNDRCHLSPLGGKRLAEEVAPEIKKLAKKLGYTK